jgi:hypothetical protein
LLRPPDNSITQHWEGESLRVVPSHRLHMPRADNAVNG